MKKGLIVIVAIVAVIAIIGGSMVSTYNGLVEKQADVENKEAQIQVYLQRRADLIPNLVNTVKAYAAHEEGVYTALAEARAKLNSASSPEEYNEANESFESALSRLLVVVENYPELKADKQYNALQDELSGTENRIARARTDYNSSAKSYNVSVKKFPKNIIAGIFGFEKVEYFESQDGAESVPQVSFD